MAAVVNVRKSKPGKIFYRFFPTREITSLPPEPRPLPPWQHEI